MQKILLSFLFFSLLSLDLFSQSEFDGYVLYNRQNQNTTYLVDKEGDVRLRYPYGFKIEGIVEDIKKLIE